MSSKSAVARGVLQWEDLDSVSDPLPDSSIDWSDDDDSPIQGRWLRALLDAGFLTPALVASLAAELEETPDDLTLDLSGTRDPWVRRLSRRLLRQDASPAGSSEQVNFALEHRFLANWSRYTVERRLGAGGMGTVYKALDPTLGRYVALKFLHRNDDRQTQRFLREARAQARVAHPHVCQVYEVGEVEGRTYIAMQYIDGRSLSELCEELAVETRLRLIRDVAQAVHAAHGMGLIHRDLKPGNILLERKESGELHPFVVDFGLALDLEATVTRTLICGTPAYISPEQAQGKALDQRTDIYSLGVVLYELLTGFPPFENANVAGLVAQVVQEEPKPLRHIDPTISRDLETVVAKCLEKDPAKRYESARDLAQDLDRLLEGDPIFARPAGWTYRARKRLSKNRALAAVSVAAVLALAALGLFSARQQWRARERAELAQSFGKRIGEWESSMQYEALLPRHDITPHKRLLRQGLEAIAGEMKRLGKIAEGPGNFALGQGYLALHQPETARLYLERAWNAGEREPEVAVALGEALTSSYVRALGTRSFRSKLDDLDLDRIYRKPALFYLREAAGNPQASLYVVGLIAYLERRYPDALSAARKARLQSPSFYKAAQLESMVILAQGREAANPGRYEEAQALYQRAGEVYQHALQQAPSEPSLYAGDCDRLTSWLIVTMATRDLQPNEVARARAACDLALSVDPELSDALILKASISWRLGYQEFRRGIDPRIVLTDCIRLSQRAVSIDTRDARALNYLAVSYNLLAAWEMEHGSDSAEYVQKGIAAAQKTIEIQPGMAVAHAILANSYLILVRARQRRGLDVHKAVEAATASSQRAIALDPNLLVAYDSLGAAWSAMADFQIARGVDPSDSLAKAFAAYQQDARLNPKNATTLNNLGDVHRALGEYLLIRGSDPRQALTDAGKSFERALAIKPDDSMVRYNLGRTYRNLADELLDRGSEPGPAVAVADASLNQYLRLNPNDAEAFLEQARIRLIAARWDLKRKANPQSSLNQAAAELHRAEEIDPKNPEVFFTQAQVARFRAEATADSRRAGMALREGLDRVERALALDSGEGRYLALRGLLLYRNARLDADLARQREGARQAVASLQAALKANPLLAREYGPVLADARLAAE